MKNFQREHAGSVLFSEGLPNKPETAYNRVVTNPSEVDQILEQMDKAVDLNAESSRFRQIAKECAPQIRAAIAYISQHLNEGSFFENAQLVHGYVHPQQLLMSQPPL